MQELAYISRGALGKPTASPRFRLLPSEVFLCLYLISVITIGFDASLVKYSTILGALFACACVLENICLSGFKLESFKGVWPLGIFLGLVWFSALVIFPDGVDRAVTYTQVFMLFVGTYLTVLSTRRTWPLQIGFLTGSLLIWGIQGADFSQVRLREEQRLEFSIAGGGDTLNPNSYGLFLALAILFSIKFILIDSPRLKQSWLVLVLKVATLFGIAICAHQIIVVTGSRKAQLMLLSLCLGSLAIYSSGSKHVLRLCFGCALGIALAVVVAGQIHNSASFKRFESAYEMIRFGDTEETSAADRSMMVETGIILWKQSPIIGNGFDSYRYISGFGTYSHSNPIELLANLGGLGLIFYYGSHFLGCKRAWELMKINKSYCRRIGIWFFVGISCIGLLFDAFAVSYDDKTTAIFLGSLLAVVFSSQTTRSEIRDSSVASHKAGVISKV